MIRSARLAFLLAGVLAGAAPSAHAESALVLKDGQVLRGTAIRRVDDAFVLDLEGGGSVTLPEGAIAEIRIGDDTPPAPAPAGVSGLTPAKSETLAGSIPSPDEAPSGLKTAKPETLAGIDKSLPTPSEQTRALGEPSKFQDDAVTSSLGPNMWELDPNGSNFAPSQWAESIIDNSWEPESAFDPSKDVLAKGRSTWSKPIIDNSWSPTDGFRKVGTGFVPSPPSLLREGSSAQERLGSPAEPVPTVARASGVDPWICGERIFAGEPVATGEDARKAPALEVRLLKNDWTKVIPLPLYEAAGTLSGEHARAIFTIAGANCVVVGGDLDRILGLDLDDSLAMARAASSYNQALAGSDRLTLPTGIDPLDYAFAVASLVDPDVAGDARARLTLEARKSSLETLARQVDRDCALSRGARQKQARAALGKFETPKLSRGRGGQLATFLTWSSAGGTVYRNQVVISRGGTVTVRRDPVAAHVGDHVD